jgi:hypothetical protein
MDNQIKRTTFKTKSGDYVFLSGRTLTREECIEHIRGYLSSKKNPKATKKRTIVIELND